VKDDRTLARLAVERGFLSQDQADQLLARPSGKPLLETVRDRGLLSDDQLRLLHDLLRARLTQARTALEQSARRPDDLLLGRLALEEGFLQPQDLEACLRELERSPDVPLGQLLVRRGHLATEDLLELLNEQSRRSQALPQFARYELRDRLGEGASAVVYRAWDRDLRRFVALKVLREPAGTSELVRQRFRREAQAAAGLAHPHVVTVHDAGEEGGHAFLVMELVEGRPFAESLARPGDLRARVALLEKAARGVAAAHQKGVVHRDLKPANILVTESGDPKVGDFGLAHLMDSELALTRTGTTLGTPLYMSPEQVQGRSDRISPRTDVYALGAMLYEVLAGDPPHPGATAHEIYESIIRDAPAPPRARNPAAPRDLETVALKALEKDPDRRYPDAGAFAEELARFLRGEPVRAQPASAAARAARWFRRRPGAAAVALAALAGALLGWQAFRSGRYDRAFRQGQEAWARGAADEAGAHFRRAAELLPGRPDAWVQAGRCALARGDLDAARRSWTRALEADPAHGPALFERGKQALCYGHELRPAPSKGTDSQRRRERSRAVSRPAPALLEDLRAARGLGPTERRFVDGAVALAEGRPADAAAALALYAGLNAWDAGAAALLGIACYEADDPAAAEERLTAALERHPRPAWFKARAEARFARGHFEQALEDFRRIDDAEGMGLALQALGRSAEARAEYRRAIERDPELARFYDPGFENLLLDDFESPAPSPAVWDVRGQPHAAGGYLRLESEAVDKNRWLPSLSARKTFERKPGRAFLVRGRGGLHRREGPAYLFSEKPHPFDYPVPGYGWYTSAESNFGLDVTYAAPLVGRETPLAWERVDSVDTSHVVVLRPQGAFYLLAGGRVSSPPRARLCYVADEGREPEFHFGLAASASQCWIDLARVDDLGGAWETPDGIALAVDSFARPDGPALGRAEKGDPGAWQAPSGAWRIASGELRGTGRDGLCLAPRGSADGWVEAKVRIPAGNAGAGLAFRARDPHHLMFLAGDETGLRLVKRVGGLDQDVGKLTGALTPEKTHDLRVRLDGRRFVVYLDGTPLTLKLPLEDADPGDTGGTGWGFVSRGDREVTFDDFRAWPLEVELPEGLFKKPAWARGPVIVSDSFDAPEDGALDGRQPVPGVYWSVRSGIWWVHRGKAGAKPAEGPGPGAAVLDVKKTSVDLEATLIPAGGDTRGEIGFLAGARFRDDGSMQDGVVAFVAWLRESEGYSPKVFIWERGQAREGMGLSVMKRVAPNRPLAFRLTLFGREATAYLDGAPVATATLSRAPTGTWAGLHTRYSAGVRWDDFVIRELHEFR
jgi:tRNA A-37 threonylcarbamoyl transferase component Bud32/tetratricopeptide (TPR) repeat protein